MTNKSLKIIAGFALVLSLATPALAVAPLVLSAIELAAPVVVAAGVSLLMPSSATTNLPKVGYADNYGVHRPMLARVGTTAALAVTGYLAYNELRSLVSSNPSAYPFLSTKETVPAAPAVGVVVRAPDPWKNYYNWYIISQASTHTQCYTRSDYYVYNNVLVTSSPGGGATCSGSEISYVFKYYNVTQTSASPTSSPATDAEYQAAISSSLGDLYPEALADLDKVIQNNPSALHLPSTLSTDIASAQKQLALDTQKQASAARVASLKEVRDARQAAYDANPTPENKEALDKAEAEYQEALADDAELTLDSVKDAEADSPLTPPEPPEYDTINFQPLVDMGEELGDKFPFSLLATLKNFATGLVTTPRAPAFDITFPSPINHTWHVSLERFDGIAQMVRVLIGMAFLGYCTMAIIRRWQ